MKIIVVCMNDYPIGVAYSDMGAQEIEDYDRAKWKLIFKNNPNGMQGIHYHRHIFEAVL